MCVCFITAGPITKLLCVCFIRKMETPWVGMRMGARHEDRQIMKSLRTCLVDVESECDFFL